MEGIFKLQDEIEQMKGEYTNHDLERLHKKYCWLSCIDLHHKPLDFDHFKEMIDDYIEKEKVELLNFNELIKEQDITTEDLDYLLMAKRFVYIKDARDDYRRKGILNILPFFEEITLRMGIESRDISYALTSEISDFLLNDIKINDNVLSERQNQFVLYLNDNNELVCLSSKDAEVAIGNFHISENIDNTNKVTGRPASKGVAEGEVVIVEKVSELDKVFEGCVLVSIMTHPDYTIAMRKAVAIVTDEGGITCHAAIVSRELGIPCIVGTQNATSVLKDGDQVIVNASDGIVELV